MTTSGRPEIHVHTHRTLRGLRHGVVTVYPGGVLWLRGRLKGEVRIEQGGRVHLYGHVDGDVVVGGVLVLDGGVSGRVTPAGGRTLVPPGGPTHHPCDDGSAPCTSKPPGAAR